MRPIDRTLRIVLIALIAIGSLFPFLQNLDVVDVITSIDGGGGLGRPPPPPSSRQHNSSSSAGGGEEATPSHPPGGRLIADGSSAPPVVVVPPPSSRRCHLPGGACLPRRYFSTTTTSRRHPPTYYLEPEAFADVPSRPWDESSIAPIDVGGANTQNNNAVDEIRRTMRMRYDMLIESDNSLGGEDSTLRPEYLPPQFPQWDRAIHRHILEAGDDPKMVLGLPPECCPSNVNHQFLTKNMSASNVLSDEELNDCECRSPRNYPGGVGRPMATIVTAFYEMSSKHPVRMYQKTAGQLLATADPMIIFCEPNTTWVDFFVDQRKHAPTIVVPLSANDLRLKVRFPQETLWKKQYDIDPEGPTHHRGVNTMLYVIWVEKLVLLHSAAMLNPFNTTHFLWVDTGYFRNPAPHAYRQSVVRINITEEGVKDESTLLFQMIPYAFDRDAVISGNQVLTGGNSFIGTYTGISNLYSAFYDVFWTMLATGKFVGSDQKVMYRACHTYPRACHIHKPRKYRDWLKMLGELLPGIEGGGGERIGEPLRLHEFVAPEEEDGNNVPAPPNGIVDDATSDLVWSGVKRNN